MILLKEAEQLDRVFILNRTDILTPAIDVVQTKGVELNMALIALHLERNRGDLTRIDDQFVFRPKRDDRRPLAELNMSEGYWQPQKIVRLGLLNCARKVMNEFMVIFVSMPGNLRA